MRDKVTSIYYALFGFWFVLSAPFGVSLVGIFPVYSGNSVFLGAARAELFIGFIASCILFLVIRRQWGPVRKQVRVLAVCAAAGSLGMLFTALPAFGLSPYLLLAGSMLRGLSGGVVVLAHTDNLASLEGAQVGSAICSALFVYAVADAVLRFAAVSYPVLATLILVLCPLISTYACIKLGSSAGGRRRSLSHPLEVTAKDRIAFILSNFTYGFLFGIMANFLSVPKPMTPSLFFIGVCLAMTLLFALYPRTVNYSRLFRLYAVAVAVVLPLGVVLKGQIPLLAPSLEVLLWAAQMLFTILVFGDVDYQVPGMEDVSSAMGLGLGAMGILGASLIPVDTVYPLDSPVLMAATFGCVVFLTAVVMPREDRWGSAWGFSSFSAPESFEVFVVRRANELGLEYGLTKREAEIACLLAKGLDNDAITHELVISPNTTKTHIRNLYAKMGIHSLAEFKNLIGSDEVPQSRPAESSRSIISRSIRS